MSRGPRECEEQILLLSGQRTVPSLERASAEALPRALGEGQQAWLSQVTPERWGPECRSRGATKAIERTLAFTGIRWESI